MINGLIIPDEGQVLVHDQCTQAVDLIELRRGIVMQFKEVSYFRT